MIGFNPFGYSPNGMINRISTPIPIEKEFILLQKKSLYLQEKRRPH